MQQFAPSEVVIGQPPNKHRAEDRGSSKTQVENGCLVVGVAKLDCAKGDHVADDFKEGKLPAQFHQEQANASRETPGMSPCPGLLRATT